MDVGFLHGAWTAVLLAVFVAIVVWAWSGRRARDFEEAAHLPLEEDAEDVPDGTRSGRRRRDSHEAAHGSPEHDAEDLTVPEKRGARHG